MHSVRNNGCRKRLSPQSTVKHLGCSTEKHVICQAGYNTAWWSNNLPGPWISSKCVLWSICPSEMGFVWVAVRHSMLADGHKARKGENICIGHID